MYGYYYKMHVIIENFFKTKIIIFFPISALSIMKHKNENFDENSYCMLLKKSKEKLLCDFCDETFNSRY